jgi:hypothetical protein
MSRSPCFSMVCRGVMSKLTAFAADRKEEKEYLGEAHVELVVECF